jgi:allophanate hydrolase subunit 1
MSKKAKDKDGHYDYDWIEKNRYTVLMKGVGLGFRFGISSDYIITCPTVSKKRLKRKGKVNLGSIKLGADAFFGAQGGVALNHRGGMCIIGGVDAAAFGASVTLGKMVIYKGALQEIDELKNIDRVTNKSLS